MQTTGQRLGLLLVIAAFIWHALAVLAPTPIQGPKKNTEARDFASYYYATRVAYEGGNPYEVRALNASAQRDGTRNTVHPYFYPPPFLLGMAWTLPLELPTAYRLNYLFNELALLMAALALVRWWRVLGAPLGACLAISGALMFGVPYGLQMGQVNPMVLALTLTGLWSAERNRPVLGGALVGMACMAKMSPALFVMWWLWRRKWKPAAASVLTAMLLSFAALGVTSAAHQLEFYTQVLPSLGGGEYNGLTIKIGMFGNHSVPNLWHQVFPSGENVLSAGARACALASSLAIVGYLASQFDPKTLDERRLAAQVAAIGCALLLIPVYTYEHHLIWALPALAYALTALAQGRLSAGWGVGLAGALVALCFPLPALKQFTTLMLDQRPVAAFCVQEAKFAALMLLWVCCARLGRRP